MEMSEACCCTGEGVMGACSCSLVGELPWSIALYLVVGNLSQRVGVRACVSACGNLEGKVVVVVADDRMKPVLRNGLYS